SGLVSKAIHKRDPGHHIIVEHPGPLHRIIPRRLGKGRHKVHLIADEHIHRRIHPTVTDVDEVFSFGILTSLEDEHDYLRQLAKVTSMNGRIHFFDYVDMYKVIPNKEVIGNPTKLKQVFQEAGFAVTITKRKGLLWNYLIIDGIRTDDPEAVYI
ncbi:hypothetical protein KY327_03105, partial [Candidatus Woesearchaeota archaeon]|nr:hypothetical protein [Candidatus Woesearchaeota archaeon]